MTIEIGADTSKFNEAMFKTYKQLNKLDEAMKKINSLLKKAPNDKDLYSQAFITLNKQIEVSKERLAELNKAYKILEKDFKDGKVGQDTLMALQREIKATEQNIRSFEGSLKSMSQKSSSFGELTGKIQIFDEKIGKTKESLDKLNEALKLDPKNVDVAKERQVILGQAINQTKEKLDLVRAAQTEALKEFEKGELAREEYSKICAEVVKTTGELKKLTIEASDGYKKLNDMGDKLEGFGNKANSLGNNLTMKVTAPIAGMFAAATKEAIDLESAMAGVHKTTDMTDAELNQMKDTFIQMSKDGPVAAKDLAEIGEMAGQLGIKKENIADFAKTISDLSIATNLTKEQGSMDLARFMNITQMSQDKVSNLGSAIVDLGNNFATSEAEIVQMGLRLAAQCKIIGLTEAQTMGLATALSAVGLRSEQGGSAMSRVMLKMNTAVLSTKEKVQVLNQSLEGTGFTINDVNNALNKGGKEGKKQLEAIAESIGMTADDLKELASSGEESANKLEILGKVSGLGAEGFAKAWREDPMRAITAFIDGIHTMTEKNEDLSSVFKALGINGIREIDTIQRLAGANTNLKNAVDTSTKAYEENTALAKEVGIFAETNAARFEQLKNNLVALGIKAADTLLPVLEDTVSWLMKMADKASKLDPEQIKFWVKALLGLAALGPIVKTVGILSSGLGGLFKVAGDVAGNMKLLQGGLSLAGSETGLLSKGIAQLAFSLGPKGILVAALVGGAIYGLKKLNDHMQEACIKSDVFGDEVSEGTKKAVGGFLELDQEATTSLNSLKASGDIVSQETVETITGHFASMGGQIAKKIEERKSEAIDSIKKMYEEMGGEADTHSQQLIEAVQKTYDETQKRNEEGQAKIKKILEKAKDEKRTLTDGERQEIGKIQEQMKDDGIRILSESEKDYAVIRQRMKDQAGVISTEQAAKLVEDSIKTKDKTIAEAEEEYNRRIGIAEQLRAMGTEESKKLADELVENSKKVRDKTIKDAEDRHKKIVEEAKAQAKEHVNEVDWETGKIKTGWEIFYEDMGKSYDGFWKSVDETVERWGKQISTSWGNARKNIKEWFSNIGSSASKWVSDKWQAGERALKERLVKPFKDGFELAKNTVKNLPTDITNYFIRKWNEARKIVADTITSPFKNALKTIYQFFTNFRMPRIRVNWEPLKWTGGIISLPRFRWYKKGAIFKKPTLFNTPYGAKGVGEAGPEAVLPIEKLSDIFADTMAKLENTSRGDIYISGNEFVVRNDNDIELIAKELQKMIDRKRRGLGL